MSPPKGDERGLEHSSTIVIVQTFTPIGCTVAEISVPEHKKKIERIPAYLISE